LHWYGNSKDKLAPIKYIKKAEMASKTFIDWITCGEMGYFIKEIGEASLCVKEAERLAKSALDFEYCSGVYDMLNDDRNEKRCMKISGRKRKDFMKIFSSAVNRAK
jgi:hypothetical protein